MASHLASIDSASGVTPVQEICINGDEDVSSLSDKSLCSTTGSWDISTIVAGGMDDDMVIDFDLHGNNVFVLNGSDQDGTSVYQLDLPRPLRASDVIVRCGNVVEDCKFSFEALGTPNPYPSTRPQRGGDKQIAAALRAASAIQ